ncbi:MULTISPECIES: polymer-forming cytoskeletal protein [unclassified Azospirillum]|jgi:cytoskeletal protein CcmA (bactofilin family)|uniref:bactofilin family protein n=1 Tax=unclassified Azospirillum TaxID=2630922 RepID=UPI000B687E39|nr:MULTISPECIES: polymer-forming cytoskeletal protein [unclassified Azospirillum]SNS64305.1 Polymer-forming protein [Azospirillum sp. RU38E]SNS83303.1 Polymer-forming protein [Azospirillum sp. RU37A]
MFAKVKERIEAGTRPGNSPSGNGSNGGPGAAERKAIPSIISRDMVITGDLDTPGELHVEGSIRGDVRCARLIIGATGSVQGHIFATTVRIHGRVQGEINAEEVFLLNGSTISGDVVQTMLEIAPGASFEGAVRRRGADAAPRMLAAPVAPPETRIDAAEPAAATDAGIPSPEPEVAGASLTEAAAALVAADKEPVPVKLSETSEGDRPAQPNTNLP